MDTSRNERLKALRAIGLAETASPAEIVRAYHRLARLTHPDVTGVADSAAGGRFAEISAAYRFLSQDPRPAQHRAADPARRRVPFVRMVDEPGHGARSRPPISAGPVRFSPAPGWWR